MRKLTGQCLCRAATYAVEDAFAYAMNCHCSNCRRARGAFKPMAGITRAAHIFAGFKVPWFDITDDLPHHAQWG
jgi:hypothetical protein